MLLKEQQQSVPKKEGHAAAKQKKNEFLSHLDEYPRIYKDIKQFGTKAMSYSHFQPGMKIFRHPEMEGFIGFSEKLGYNYVLSNPVTAPDQYEMITKQYLKKYPRSYFCQIDGYYATILKGFGYAIYPFGVENIIDLDAFKVTWKKRSNLKRFVSRLNNLGYEVKEERVADIELMEISDEWLAYKHIKKELRFMARPFEGAREPDTRIFTLWKDGKVLGFCLFDPVYSTQKNGFVTSYVLQHVRVLREAPNGAADHLLVNALYRFKEEGLRTASLGLAPLYQRERGRQERFDLTEILLRALYKSNLFYHYRQVGEHKDRYHGRKVQTYLACPRNHSLNGLYGVLRVNNLS